MTDQPRPIGKKTVAKQGNSLAITVTDAAKEAGLSAGDELHSFIAPDGQGVLFILRAFDPQGDGWTACDEKPRAIRDRNEFSQYLTLSEQNLTALGVGLGDDVEVSASDWQILLRPW